MPTPGGFVTFQLRNNPASRHRCQNTDGRFEKSPRFSALKTWDRAEVTGDIGKIAFSLSAQAGEAGSLTAHPEALSD